MQTDTEEEYMTESQSEQEDYRQPRGYQQHNHIAYQHQHQYQPDPYQQQSRLPVVQEEDYASPVPHHYQQQQQQHQQQSLSASTNSAGQIQRTLDLLSAHKLSIAEMVEVSLPSLLFPFVPITYSLFVVYCR